MAIYTLKKQATEYLNERARIGVYTDVRGYLVPVCVGTVSAKTDGRLTLATTAGFSVQLPDLIQLQRDVYWLLEGQPEQCKGLINEQTI